MNRHQSISRSGPHHNAFMRERMLDTIEWEELPSLVGALRRQDFATTHGSVWSSTERLGLAERVQPEPAPSPFVEPIDGLFVREIAGDEVFRHFFGDGCARH